MGVLCAVSSVLCCAAACAASARYSTARPQPERLRTANITVRFCTCPVPWLVFCSRPKGPFLFFFLKPCSCTLHLPPHMHTHTDTHTDAHAHAHTDAHTHARAHTRTDAHTHTQRCTHRCTHRCTRKNQPSSPLPCAQLTAVLRLSHPVLVLGATGAGPTCPACSLRRLPAALSAARRQCLHGALAHARTSRGHHVASCLARLRLSFSPPESIATALVVPGMFEPVL